MINIELAQIAESHWKEENLLKLRNIQGKKASHKSMWNLMNIWLLLPGIGLYCHKNFIIK